MGEADEEEKEAIIDGVIQKVFQSGKTKDGARGAILQLSYGFLQTNAPRVAQSKQPLRAPAVIYYDSILLVKRFSRSKMALQDLSSITVAAAVAPRTINCSLPNFDRPTATDLSAAHLPYNQEEGAIALLFASQLNS